MKQIPLDTKFNSHVLKGSSRDDCWGWTGTTDQYGYGRIGLGRGFTIKAHRFSYQQVHGQIPENLVVMHKCDNPPCCNPLHLVAGTQKENVRDAAGKNRLNPKSLLNLQPGARGFHGAGPSTKGAKNGKR